MLCTHAWLWWLSGPRFLPITLHIALASVALEPMHDDPADRLVVATTLAHQAVLVTTDERLRALAVLECRW